MMKPYDQNYQGQETPHWEGFSLLENLERF